MQTIDGRTVYTELREVIAPAHTLLLVWDMQNGLVNRAFNREPLLKATATLLAAARRAQVPILYTRIQRLPLRFEAPARIAQYIQRLGTTDPKALAQGPFGSDPQATAFPPAIAPDAKADLVIDKNTPSVFIGTNVELMMHNAGLETLVIAGISSEIGVESSARDALNRGYYTVVVKDAVSSADQAAHERTLLSLARLCTLATVSEVAAAWK